MCKILSKEECILLRKDRIVKNVVQLVSRFSYSAHDNKDPDSIYVYFGTVDLLQNISIYVYVSVIRTLGIFKMRVSRAELTVRFVTKTPIWVLFYIQSRS